ncbi:MAG TPA: hypothetical protein VJH21_01190 [Candidatus Paceibacterota bacterium]
MESLKKYKLTIFALVIFAVLAFVYLFYFSGDQTDTLTSNGSTAGATTVDEELLALLLSMKSIKLDATVFQSPEFRSLVDFSRILETEPAGRLNPFASLERSASKNAQ